ncbi:MAG TPA: recombination-associated protein RdgC [Zetaproteobacteria bacterium]|nr:recombination-associated protein RdgC [Zetaproteobacteria bacterium]
MWFRNIQFYRFEQPFTMTGKQLQAALEGRVARSCGQMELACEGWGKPLGLEGQMLVHETDGRLMICLRREDKVLPASLVREKVAEKAFEIEGQAGRPVGRKERADIKEQVLQELLPRALVKASHTYAYIDAKNDWLIVNAASAKKAEDLIMLLRKTLGTLNVVLPQTKISPESAMTQWMMDDASLPQGFDVEDECELRLVGEVTSTVRCKYVDVASSEVRAHVLSGKRVFKMGMGWQGKVSFVLSDDTSIRRIRFDSELVEQADADGDASAQFDADFAIMGAELGMLIPELLSALDASADE